MSFDRHKLCRWLMTPKAIRAPMQRLGSTRAAPMVTIFKSHLYLLDLSSPCIGDSESYRVYGSATSLGLEVKPLRPLAYVLLRKVISIHK